MEIQFISHENIYVAVCPFAEKDVARAAGFRWNPTARRWWTGDLAVAAKLAQYADEACRARLEAIARDKEETLHASRAAASDQDFPVPEGFEYLPFQKAGIQFLLKKNDVLLADMMGLGKTIQVIGLLNSLPKQNRILIVCPASLRLNWKRELERWLVHDYRIGVAISDDWPEGADICIVNYDILSRHTQHLSGIWDLLVLDESHYCKNPKAARSKAALSVHAQRKIALTGTPIPNRPVEIWPILHYLDPVTWPNFWYFGKRYCNGHQEAVTSRRIVWNFDGASHLEELQEKLRSSIMIRRLKEDVLQELPPKRRQVIELPPNGASAVVEREKAMLARHQEILVQLKSAVELAKASDNPDDYEQAVARLQRGMSVAFGEMSVARHETALAKVPHVVQHVTDMLEGGVEKVVVFIHHKDVCAQIVAALDAYGVVSLTGDTGMRARQKAVDRFQNDASVRVFVGSITAAGVGITLTSAHHVVMAELDWVPGNVTQAEDRCHRIGTVDSVLVQHLVFDGSIDCNMAQTLVAKQNVIDKALDDNREELHVPILPMPPQDMTHFPSAKTVDTEAPTLTPEAIAAIHTGLQMLAGMCDGARSLDGMGFNKLDTHIGKSLAHAPRLTAKQAVLGKRLVQKYRRQLPDDLLTTLLHKE